MSLPGSLQNEVDRALNLRRELTEAKLTKRELLKLGLLVGGKIAIPAAGSLATALAPKALAQMEGPRTRPWMAPLHIPPVLSPVNLNPAPTAEAAIGESPRPRHQRWAELRPRKTYEIRVQEALHSFHPELPPARVWGYNGITPGPTIVARHGEPIVVRHRNDLPPQHRGFGMPQISTHLHNAHTAWESDGYPTEYFGPGTFRDYLYGNVCPGFNSANDYGDPREALGTLWYHDHRIDFTAQNVYKGLAGFYLLFDEVDSGNETDSNPRALRLPSGSYDVPLAISDRVLDSTGQPFFDVFNLDGIVGNKILVNGAIQPFFQVARRKYRFRILNASSARFYEIALSNGQPFTVIANDGNLLPRPLSMRSIRLGSAERIDVVVDFSNVRLGESITLLNRLEQKDGRGPTGKPLERPDQLLRFDVVREAPDPSRVPATLRELPEIKVADAVRTRRWRFDRKSGAWAINSEIFDDERPRARVRRDSAEIWVFENGSGGGWEHPIHCHMEEFRVLSVDDAAPPVHQRGRKDVFILGPNREARVFMRFRDFTGKYLMHCHNSLHEDHGMMLRWDSVE